MKPENPTTIENIGMLSLINYISFTVVFFILKSSMGYSGTSWIVIFLIITGIIQFINNMYITSYPQICGEWNPKIAFTATIIPWLFIFGLSCICLVLIPGWLRVFSNTIGWSFVQMLYNLKNKVDKVFMEPVPRTDENISLIETARLLYTNRNMFINEVDISDYDISGGTVNWNSLDKILTVMNVEHSQKHSEKTDLYNALVMKEEVGYFVWVILIGSVSILVSTNSVILSNCNSIEFNF